MSIESVFGNRPRLPEHLRAADGSLSAADGVAWLREQAIGQWLSRHGVFEVSVSRLAARVAEVGEDSATAEVLRSKMEAERAED